MSSPLSFAGPNLAKRGYKAKLKNVDNVKMLPIANASCQLFLATKGTDFTKSSCSFVFSVASKLIFPPVPQVLEVAASRGAAESQGLFLATKGTEFTKSLCSFVFSVASKLIFRPCRRSYKLPPRAKSQGLFLATKNTEFTKSLHSFVFSVASKLTLAFASLMPKRD